MAPCTACAAPLRAGARFCTRCGAPVAVTDAVPAVADAAPPPPARIPLTGRIAAPPARSRAATLAFAAGLAPLAISVLGNVVAAQLGAVAVERAEAGQDGAWAPVLLALALVFVLNAGTLTMCAILGARGLRETANGITRGRGLAIAGLAVGGANLVLWVAGLLVSIGGLSAVLA
jgi:hypothetical protein